MRPEGDGEDGHLTWTVGAVGSVASWVQHLPFDYLRLNPKFCYT